MDLRALLPATASLARVVAVTAVKAKEQAVAAMAATVTATALSVIQGTSFHPTNATLRQPPYQQPPYQPPPCQPLL